MARRWIGHSCAGVQGLVLEIAERTVEQSSHGFGRIALAPVCGAEPVADVRRAVLAHIESAGADDGAVGECDQIGLFIGAQIGAGDPVVRVGALVGMWNARGVFGDAAVVRESRNRFSVPEARRTQHKPLRLEDGDTSLAYLLRLKSVRADHGRFLLKELSAPAKKLRGGAGVPSPPRKEPVTRFR